MQRLTNITVRSGFGHNHYSPAEFVRLPLSERIQLLMAQKVEFLDEYGNPMPSLDAVDQLPRTGGVEAPKKKW